MIFKEAFSSGVFAPLRSLASEDEVNAWLHTKPGTYHSMHVERISPTLFHIRDSKEAAFYVVSADELLQFILSRLTLREIDPEWKASVRQLTSEELLSILDDL